MIYAVLGVVAVVSASVMLVRRRRDVVTRAEIVAVRTSRLASDLELRYPTVRFRDADGEDVRVEMPALESARVGARVGVRYRRGDLSRRRYEVVRADLPLLVVGLGLLVVAPMPLAPAALLFLGGTFAASGLWMLRGRLTGVEVRGTVAAVDWKKDGTSRLWRPVVRFLDTDEQPHVVAYEGWTNITRAPEVGDPIVLWYRRKDPEQITLAAWTLVGAGVLGVGVLMLAGGAAVLLGS